VSLLVDLIGGQTQKPSSMFLSVFSEFPIKKSFNWDENVHWQQSKVAVKQFLDHGYEIFQAVRHKCSELRLQEGQMAFPTAGLLYEAGFRSQILQRLAFTSIRRSIGLTEGSPEWTQWDQTFKNSVPGVFGLPTKLSPTYAHYRERIEK